MPNIRDINTLDKLEAAMNDIPERKRTPTEVPMELLDAASQAALMGFCRGRELKGEYVLTLVPREAETDSN